MPPTIQITLLSPTEDETIKGADWQNVTSCFVTSHEGQMTIYQVLIPPALRKIKWLTPLSRYSRQGA